MYHKLALSWYVIVTTILKRTLFYPPIIMYNISVELEAGPMVQTTPVSRTLADRLMMSKFNFETKGYISLIFSLFVAIWLILEWLPSY